MVNKKVNNFMGKFFNKLLRAVPTLAFIGKSKQFQGNYSTWEEARNQSTGYDSDLILKRAIHCRNWVIKGGASYEQDLRMYHDKPFKPESLASLLWIYTQENKLRVLDFGGSFGTSYYIHLDFLNGLDLKWNVVEQKKYIDYAKKNYETEKLKFFHTYDKCQDINVLYLSGVLAYTESPYKILKELLTLGTDYIIIDRNHFLKDPLSKTRLAVQKTKKMTFPTSFPVWLFNKNELMEVLSNYEIVREWKENMESEGMYYGGALLKLKADR